jgi:hypothetical protein
VAYRVVCISATDGAAGEEIAPLVADRLGFRLVDEQIVARAAEEAGVELKVAAGVEQRRSLVSRVLAEIPAAGAASAAAYGAFAPIEDDVSDSSLRGLIRSAIEEIAGRGDAVIVSHAASFALGEHPHALRVFLTASPDRRAARVLEMRDCSDKEAKKFVARGDTNRADYLKRFYRVSSEQPTHYDIVLNTDRLSAEEAADLVVQAASA